MGEDQADQAKDQLQRLQDRLRVLTDTARAFAEATADYQRLLDIVARSLAEIVEDSCIVFVLSEDGRALLPEAIHTPDAEALRYIRAKYAAGPLEVAGQPAVQRALQTGESLLVAHVSREQQRRDTNDEYIEFTSRLGVHSFLIVPLRLHGRSIGLLSLARFRPSSPPYDEHDRALAQNLSDLAALAIGNSRLYTGERQARQAAEEAKETLRHSEAAQRLLFEDSPLASFVFETDSLRLLEANDAALNLYGYSRSEFLQLGMLDLRPPEEAPVLLAALRAVGDADTTGIARHRRKDGAVIFVEGKSHLSSFRGRRARLAVVNDITERLQAEKDRESLGDQLRQAQKMEAVGRLAGGVAHDFNNVLSVILSYAGAILDDAPPGDPLRADIEEVQKAAQRAADLTKQLLMFSRQQVLEPRILDLNEILRGMDRMLGRLLGEEVVLAFGLDDSLGSVRADRSSIEQVLMNLVVNARDAMPAGGKLTIETANVMLGDTDPPGPPGARPGPHVMLSVTDSGVGMDKATRERIFEPFFTTKEMGRGTGLGLSTVFGIVQQSEGRVSVQSEPGRGTTFTICLPRVQGPVDAVPAPPATPASRRGWETILLAEDEDQVRAVARSILERSGYQVIAARTGGEALLLSERHAAPIHLLLTDIVMPGMSGTELASRLVAGRPETKVLYMSGYTGDSVLRHGVIESGTAFLQKPFTAERLTRRVREVLSPSGDAPAEAETPPRRRG